MAVIKTQFTLRLDLKVHAKIKKIAINTINTFFIKLPSFFNTVYHKNVEKSS